MAEQPGRNGIAGGRYTSGRRYISQGSDGQIAVMFALSMLAVVPLMGLIFDGGNIYVQRRTAQNAADSAALAGTRALMHATVQLQDPTVANVVCTYLTLNTFGVTPSPTRSDGTPSASFVGITGAPLVPAAPINLPTKPDPARPGQTVLDCTTPSLNDIPDLAAGVHVDATIGPFPTFIAGFLGKGIANGDGAGFARATTTASSTVQGSAVTSFAADNAPFIVCGVNTKLASIPDPLHPGLSNYPILLPGGPPYKIDPTAFGTTYQIHGTGIDACGDTASWKGLADQSANYNVAKLDLGTTSAILSDLTGSGSNTTKNRVDGFGGCDSATQDSCYMIIPIAISSPLPVTNKTKLCVAWGAFWVTARSFNTVHWGKLVGAFNVGIGPDTFSWTFKDRATYQIVSMGASS